METGTPGSGVLSRIRSSRWLGLAGIALGFMLVLGIYGVFGANYVEHGELTPLESYQPLAAREVMGSRVPYRDFAYPEMPVAPYLGGILLSLTGHGLAAHRVVSLVFGGVALCVIMVALKRRLGVWAPGFAAAFAAAVSLHWTAIQAHATPHPATGMFLAIAFFGAVAMRSFTARVALFAAASALGIGCELRAAPVVLLLLAIVVMEAGNIKRRLVAVGAVVVALAVLLSPFLITAPRNLFFFIWTYQWAPDLSGQGRYVFAEWWVLSPAAILVLTTGLVGVPTLIRRGQITPVLLLAAGVVGVSLPLVMDSTPEHFIAPAVPLALASGVVAMWTTLGHRNNSFRYMVWLMPFVSLIYPFPPASTGDQGLFEEIDEVVEILREQAPPGPLLTTVPAIAVEAGRRVVPGTETGQYSTMSSARRRRARGLRLTTLDDLAETLQKKVPAALVLSRDPFHGSFRLEVPSMSRQPKREILRFEKEIRRNYLSLHSTRTMEVLVKR